MRQKYVEVARAAAGTLLSAQVEEGALLLFIFLFLFFFAPPRCSGARQRRRDHAAVLGGKQALCIRVVLRSEPAGPRKAPHKTCLFALFFPRVCASFLQLFTNRRCLFKIIIISLRRVKF